MTIFAGGKGYFQIDLAVGRIQTDHVIARPADEHSPAGLLDDDRGRIGCLVVECPPSLRAGLLIEGQQARPFRAELDDHQLAIDQRGRGNAPDRRADLVVHTRVLLPQQFSRRRIETVKMSHGSQGISTAIVDGDAGPRPRHVPDVLVGAVVGEVPQVVAGLPIEAVDPFHRSAARSAGQ